MTKDTPRDRIARMIGEGVEWRLRTAGHAVFAGEVMSGLRAQTKGNLPEVLAHRGQIISAAAHQGKGYRPDVWAAVNALTSLRGATVAQMKDTVRVHGIPDYSDRME